MITSLDLLIAFDYNPTSIHSKRHELSRTKTILDPTTFRVCVLEDSNALPTGL
jgi:hypothetical protein